jgi:hypothetical protein
MTRASNWTGVGVSLKFDFIIIHESAHEWFGNSVSAADVSDMWIHEGWATYLECLYVEHAFGYDDALKYVNGYKSRVQNRTPIITPRGLHRSPPQDMYFKGALFLHTLRNVVNDDKRWWKLMTPLFDQYLRHAELPSLELKFDKTNSSVSYRWVAGAKGFAMPVRAGKKGQWQIIQPAAEWKSMPWSPANGEFEVATDLYYVNVTRTIG